MESFCQKDCHICPRREALGCMGCRPKYDAPGYPGCDIAQCCKAKGHANCGTCQFSGTCDKLSRRDSMPDEKPRNLRRAAELKDKQIARAAFLGRWLWALFWLIIPSILGAILLTEPVLNLFPDLLWVGIGLQIMTVLSSCGIQLLISRYSRHFRNGVWFALPSYCVLLPFLFLSLETKGHVIAALLLCALSVFLSMLSIRQQIAGYREILAGVDDALAKKYSRLQSSFQWCLGIACISMTALPILQVIMPLFILALAICIYWSAVLGIILLIHLYRTAKTFREYRPEN